MNPTSTERDTNRTKVPNRTTAATMVMPPASTASSPASAGQDARSFGATVMSTPKIIVQVVTAGPRISEGVAERAAPTTPITMAAAIPVAGSSPAMAAKAMHCGIETNATVTPAHSSTGSPDDRSPTVGGFRFAPTTRSLPTPT